VILIYNETVQDAEAAKQYQELMEKQKVCFLLCLILHSLSLICQERVGLLNSQLIR